VIKKDPEAEQRLVLAVFLSVAIYWLWTAFFLPIPPPPDPSAATAQTPQEVPAGSGTFPFDQPSSQAAAPIEVPVVELPERWIPFNSDGIGAELTSEGGGLANLTIVGHRSPYEVQAIWNRLFDKVKGEAPEEWLPWGEEPGPELLISAEGLALTGGAGEGFIVTRHAVSSGMSASASHTTADRIEVLRTWTHTNDPNVIEVQVSFTNLGEQPWSGPLWIGTVDRFVGEAGRYSNVARPVISVDGDLETLEDLEDVQEGPDPQEGSVGWFGIADRYFIVAAIPDFPWGKGVFARTFDGREGAFLVEQVNLMPGQVETLSLKLFAGAKDLDVLSAHHKDLAAAVDFGIFGFFARVLLWILQGFYGLVGNWGTAIILMTLAIKTSFWPLTQKSFSSGRKMQALQPRIQALKEKFPDDPQRQGTEQMNLFKEEGVNPLGGCIPMIIQMPVWFALYSVLLFSVDVYHAEFLYLKDLSSPDPWGILPTLVGVLMVLQQRLTPMSPSMDPTQQKIMRAMPLVFVFIMYSFPSGLALYILVNTCLSILQMWLVNKAYPVVSPPTATAVQKA
jgi:YidC/Oxa1 family membrane protein insertase